MLAQLNTHPADESFDRTASHMAGEYVSYPAKTENEPSWKEMYWEMHELNHKHWSELKSHPAKTLTDAIELLEKEANKPWADVEMPTLWDAIEILKKASER